ncbi:MAG: alpha-N-arabinofuranosidase [Verrucomicrobiae bacterium]
MKPSACCIDPRHALHAVDSRLFGSFVEHMGRSIYTGIFEPGHPTAAADGFRQDVAALIRELSPTLLRYPGGNFVSTYNWEDGVGPVESRPVRLDPAWRTTEPNTVGTNEFLTWCREVGSEPMLAFNLGTRGVAEALAYWEYCNHPGGTALSDRRISHGYREPHNVRLWCLGNEMDGPWQMGHKTAEEYGRLACETARALKQCDPSLELVVAGSCSSGLPTYPEWDRVVLEHTYEFVDHISLHLYVNDNELPDLPAYLAVGLRMEAMIRTIAATCDYVKALKRGKKDIHLAFDEWNVWHWKNLNPPGFQPWCQAPAQVEQTYTMAEAVIFGSLIISLIRNADRVRIANLAQLVNVIAPIMTAPGGPAWRQAIFFPFLHASKWGRGEVVFSRLESPTYPTKEFGEVPYLDAVAVRDLVSGVVTVFAISRHLTESFPLGLDVDEHITLTDPDPHAANTREVPDRLVLHPAPQPGTLPPLSWNVLRLSHPPAAAR